MLAERFRSVRKELHKSQKAFAAELGLSLSGLQGYEAGTFAPGSQALEALCRIGIDINWLLIGEGMMWRSGRGPAATASASGNEGAVGPEDRSSSVPGATRIEDGVQAFQRSEQNDAWKRLDFGRVA